MAEVAGTLITEALRRVRDPRGEAHARSDVLTFLDRCQKMINVFTKQVLDPVTVTTTPMQQVYQMSDVLPDAVDIVDIKEGNRSLPRVPWPTLFYTDREWTRAQGSRYEVFSQLGLDLLILHPAESIAGSIVAVSVKDTADLANEDTATDVVDDDLPAVLDLLEAVLNLRQREFTPSADAMKRAASRLLVDRRP